MPTDAVPRWDLILASASPRRAELLRQLGWRFRVVPSDVPEVHYEAMTAIEISRVNAYRKSRRVAQDHPDAIVLGADTLVFLDTMLFGKPANLKEARDMLLRLQGRVHDVVTAVCLIQLGERRQLLFAETTAVKFRPLERSDVDEYLSRVNPLDKAGAYAIQEQGERLVESIRGSYTNVIGLPTERLQAELGRWEEVPRAAVL